MAVNGDPYGFYPDRTKYPLADLDGQLQPAEHHHVLSQIDDIDDLDQKYAPINHNHDDRYALINHTHKAEDIIPDDPSDAELRKLLVTETGVDQSNHPGEDGVYHSGTSYDNFCYYSRTGNVVTIDILAWLPLLEDGVYEIELGQLPKGYRPLISETSPQITLVPAALRNSYNRYWVTISPASSASKPGTVRVFSTGVRDSVEPNLRVRVAGSISFTCKYEA